MASKTADQVSVQSVPSVRPIVKFLRLPSDDLSEAYLEGLQCTSCGQTYTYEATRRACSRCTGAEAEQFKTVRLSDEGEVWVYTIVHQSFPGVETPFVGAIVDVPVEGDAEHTVAVRANVVGVDPDPKSVSMGMKVKMRTRIAREDREGNAVALFEYVPA